MSDSSTNSNATTVSEPDSNQAVHEPPRSIAPTPQLSTRGLFIALATVCFVPLFGLSIYAVIFGKASEHELPVEILIDRRPLMTVEGNSQLMDDVVVVTNEADFEIPNITMNLNGQYFLYQDKPLAVGETLVLRQAAFATKSSQFWVPGRYPITEITVTGKLPTGARGVKEVQF
ncbi:MULTISPECIES: hypothetical protein [Rhodopirellula]|uniref:hypothetical protein n=1 Tax=Rhodopirellula TaxID=265488 RepID=UPI002580DBC9|nr:hypothetical protein [Rhodopirellula sp. UBA1907]|tara:strand:- start:10040 stop:10561 length:522 start_codon:yes stop_codon:yes gene_type:complete